MSKPWSKVEEKVRQEARGMLADELRAKVLEYRDKANSVPQDGTKENRTLWRRYATLRDIWEEAWLGIGAFKKV